MVRPPIPWIVATTLLTVHVGCSSPDERLIQLSEQNAARQADQNQQMARHSQQVIDSSRELVAADARARAELIRSQQQLQSGVQAERASLDRQHEELDAERRSLAAARHRDPIVAAAMASVTALLLCALPLIVCVYLLKAMQYESPDSALAELLVEEMATDHPVLLVQGTPNHARLSHDAGPAATSGDST